MFLEILQVVNPERSSDLRHDMKGFLLKALAETRGPVLPDERRIRTAQEVHRGARSTKALHQIRGRNRGGFHFLSRDCGQQAINVNNSGGGRG